MKIKEVRCFGAFDCAPRPWAITLIPATLSGDFTQSSAPMIRITGPQNQSDGPHPAEYIGTVRDFTKRVWQKAHCFWDLGLNSVI